MFLSRTGIEQQREKALAKTGLHCPVFFLNIHPTHFKSNVKGKFALNKAEEQMKMFADQLLGFFR